MLVDRDGETICISNYAHCSEESCHCRSSERTNAVMLRLRKGYYHDKYTDIVKVVLNSSLLCMAKVMKLSKFLWHSVSIKEEQTTNNPKIE